MSEPPTLVWIGRFQPFHLGHLQFLRRVIAAARGAPVLIGVLVMKGANPPSDDQIEDRGRPELNPYTASQRCLIIERVLVEEEMDHQVRVIALPRTDVHWEMAVDMLPGRRVICLSGSRDGPDAKFEEGKAERFANLNETVLELTLDEPPLPVSGTRVREALLAGRDLGGLVHPSTVEVLRTNFLTDTVEPSSCVPESA